MKKLVGGWSLLVVLAMLLLSCATSRSSTTTLTTTALSAQEISSNAVAASTKIDACKLDMDMAMTIEVIGGTDPGKLTMLENASGYVSIANKEMTLTMNMNMDIPGQGKQDMSIEVYLVGGWAYMKVNVPLLGEQWIKMNLTDELWASESQIFQQGEFLQTAVDVSLVGNESISGVDCYVLNITPNIKELIKWVLSQSRSEQSGLDLSDVDLSKLFKNISIKQWVAKDSFLPMRQDMTVVIEMRPADVGATANDFEGMALTLSGRVDYYDYGKKVSIELPSEALNAQQMPTQQ